MRINLTKKDLVNIVYMQIGFSKQISENFIDEFFFLIVENLQKEKKLKISKFGTFSIREKKIKELEEILKLKRKKIFQKEMLFYLNLLKNLKNF